MKTILVTGGSGTIGSAFINEVKNDFHIVSLARNEKAQVALKRQFSNIEIRMGSVENMMELESVYRKYSPDMVIHAAAMKHVDTAEKQPSVAIKSNILGSLNVIELSSRYNVPITIGVSTDKACNPDNVYGQSKYLMERLFQEHDTPHVRFLNCRFGNVAWSNGSVLPFWKRLYLEGKPLPVTHPEMTRLMFSRVSAAKLILKAIEISEKKNEYFILSKKMRKVNMLEMAKHISKKIEIVGLRQGEKIDEELVSNHELDFASVIEDDYVIITPNKKSYGENKLTYSISSSNAQIMSEEELKEIIGDKESWKKSSLNTYY
jgi:UDP-N-acetyl-D-glucosamine 4,6-dehydratase